MTEALSGVEPAIVPSGHRSSTQLPDGLRSRILASPVVRERLVAYVFPEAQAERRVRDALDRVPRDATRYALLGCGIGWLAYELACRLEHAEVVGFDPDPTSIDVAENLFSRANLSFEAGPGADRSLDDFGAIIVVDAAASSAGVQAMLERATAPTLTLQDLDRRDPPFPKPSEGERWPLADSTRSDRVTARLGMHVTSDGYLVSRQSGPRVLIVMPERGGYSETFIRAHIERLPADVFLLVGGVPDMQDEDGRDLVPRFAGASRSLFRRVVGRRGTRWLEQYWLRRHLRARHIDIVLAEYGTRGVQMLSACTRMGIPLVTHFFGYDAAARPVLEKHAQGYRRLFRERAPLVVVSQHMAARLTEIGADPATLSVIACGVDPDRETATPAFDDPPVFLAVGRFVEKKAPHLTLLAFEALHREVPESRLTMVGDGPLLGLCKQLAKALGIQNSVDFLGALPHDQLPFLYRTSRAFVQHSVEAANGDSEGMPVAILEAGAAGLPVVATRHAGIPEAVIDGQTGYLVPEGAVLDMADRLRRLALDPALAERLGSAGRRHVRRSFALDDSLARLWQVLKAARAQHTGAASDRPDRHR